MRGIGGGGVARAESSVVSDDHTQCDLRLAGIMSTWRRISRDMSCRGWRCAAAPPEPLLDRVSALASKDLKSLTSSLGIDHFTCSTVAAALAVAAGLVLAMVLFAYLRERSLEDLRAWRGPSTAWSCAAGGGCQVTSPA